MTIYLIVREERYDGPETVLLATNDKDSAHTCLTRLIESNKDGEKEFKIVVMPLLDNLDGFDHRLEYTCFIDSNGKITEWADQVMQTGEETEFEATVAKTFCSAHSVISAEVARARAMAKAKELGYPV